MAVSIGRTRVAARTTNGDQTITPSGMTGLTSKAVMFLWSYATVDATDTDGLVRGIGFADGSVQACTNWFARHNQADSTSGTAGITSRCIELYNDSGTLLAYAVFSSFGSNGAVTLTWTITSGTAILIDCVFFAGSDLSVDVAATLLTNTVDTAHDITAPGFEPDDVIAFTIGNVTAHQGFSMGFVHNDRAGGITTRGALWRDRTGRGSSESTAVVRSTISTANVFCGIGAGAWAADNSCWLEASTFDASGFTATTRNAAPGADGYLVTLCLRYGSSPVVASKVYTYNTPTGTGESTDNNPNFTPQAVFYIASMMEAINTYNTNGFSGSSGFCSIQTAAQGGQNCISGSNEDNVTTTNTQSRTNDQAVDLPLHTGAAGLAATFVSFGATGVTLNWSDIETNAKIWLALAIEAASSGTQYPQSVSGAITPSGTVVNRTSKPLSGALTSSGALINRAGKILSGTLSPDGTLARSARKILSGELTSSGVVAAIKIALISLGGELTMAGTVILQTGKSLAGALVPDGSLVRSSRKVLDGALTSAGSLVNQTRKILSGELTPSGILAAVKTALISLGGELTMAGELVRQAGKSVAGTLAPDGGLVRSIAKILVGTLAPDGGLMRSIAKILAGALSPSGELSSEITSPEEAAATVRKSNRHRLKYDNLNSLGYPEARYNRNRGPR